jgi:radical SAM protein with 4Fe4S-binding SPASM domain
VDTRHEPVDVNIPRKGRLIHSAFHEPAAGRPPLFSLVELNLTGLCNRTCVFCPRADDAVYPNRHEHIAVELYEKVVRELGALDYRGMLLHSGFSEPLLAKRVETLLELGRRYCPRARLEVVTNGDHVTVDRLRRLFAAGLDTLLVSMYDGPEQQGTFEGMRAAAGLTEEQVVLRARWLPPEEQFGMALTNRGGLVAIPAAGVGPLRVPLDRPCHYPFYMTMIDHDGSVLVCTHDWGRKLIIGNVREHSLQELWDGDAMRSVRRRLATGNRGSSPCDVCDVDGTLMGGRHFDAWLDYYERRERSAP